MCLSELLCGLGFGALTAMCFKIHCSNESSNKKNRVHPSNDINNMTPYELQIHSAHMNIYNPNK